MAPELKEDIFREMPLRYLGYANELGEAFRHLVPLQLVRSSYAISSGYVLSHAVSKGLKAHASHAAMLEHLPAHHRHHSLNTPNHSVNTRELVSPAVVFVDTLLWQGLASVLIPGLAINRLCTMSQFVLRKRAGHLSLAIRNWSVTAIGILAIPVIIHPIDRVVDKLMDSVLRPLFIQSPQT